MPKQTLNIYCEGESKSKKKIWAMSNTAYDKKEGIKRVFGAKWNPSKKAWVFKDKHRKWMSPEAIKKIYKELPYDPFSRSLKRQQDKEEAKNMDNEIHEIHKIRDEWCKIPLSSIEKTEIIVTKELCDNKYRRGINHYSLITGPPDLVNPLAKDDFHIKIIRHEVDYIRKVAVVVKYTCYSD